MPALVAQMPFAEQAGGIARRAQPLRQRHLASIHLGGRAKHIGHTRAKIVPPRHQRRPRRRTHRAHVKPREFHRLPPKRINVRGPDVRVAMTGEVAVTKIVDQKQDDIGPACRTCVCGRHRHHRHTREHSSNHDRPYRPGEDKFNESVRLPCHKSQRVPLCRPCATDEDCYLVRPDPVGRRVKRLTQLQVIAASSCHSGKVAGDNVAIVEEGIHLLHQTVGGVGADQSDPASGAGPSVFSTHRRRLGP